MAFEVIHKKGMKWFERFSDIKYLYKFLKKRYTGKTWGVGARGSYNRIKLLAYCAEELNYKTESEKYFNKAKELQASKNYLNDL